MPTPATPTLTIYRDGLANLNGQATAMLSRTEAVMLLPPGGPRVRWVLVPALPDLEGLADKVRLVGRADRDHLRFRYPALALALFAALPLTQKALRLQLDAGAGQGWELVAQ
jgi:hypothetical protein